MSMSELAEHLLSREMLDAAGNSSRRIAMLVERGILHRVRRGWYVRSSVWNELWPESRHRAHVLAAARDLRGSTTVFSGVSAAALLELPLYRIAPRYVHVMLGGPARHNAHDLLRHEGVLPDDDVIEIGGILCTSLERTVYDLARTLTPEAGLAVADAALASVGGDPRRFDDDAAELWLSRLRDRVGTPGVRGIRKARDLVAMADGRAQLPLESVTRYRLHQLGFQRPRLQVPVPAPDGGDFWLDIELEDANAFIECDGNAKYLDPQLTHGRSAGEVVLDEKRREDWIRGTTSRRLARCGDRDVRTVAVLAELLRRHHIRPPGPR